MKNVMRRIAALLLALVMLLSTMNFAWAAGSGSAEPKANLGSLMAGQYSSTGESAKMLWRSGMLNADRVYSYAAPASADMVTIDNAAKTVKAENYTDSYNNQWVPVSAVVKSGDMVLDEISSLTAGTPASFSCDKTSYSVDVTYHYRESVGAAEQQKMVASVNALLKAKEAMTEVAAADSLLQLVLKQKIDFNLDSVIGTMTGNTRKTEISAILSAMVGAGIPVVPDEFLISDPELAQLVTWIPSIQYNPLTDKQTVYRDSLQELLGENGGTGVAGILRNCYDISNGRISSVTGMCSNFADLPDAIAATKVQIEAIADAANTLRETMEDYGELFDLASAEIPDFAVFETDDAAVASAIETVKSKVLTSLERAEGYFTEANNYAAAAGFDMTTLLNDTANDTELVLCMVQFESNVSLPSPVTNLKVEDTTVTKNVAQATVKVVVNATVYEKDATASSVKTKERSVLLPAGTSAADAAAKAEEIRGEFLGAANWGYYDLNETNYTKVPTGGAANDLADGETYTYTYTYTPKKFRVTVTGDPDVTGIAPEYDYGQCLALPLHEGTEKVYDYTIDNTLYAQGDLYRVTKDVTIACTEGDPWTLYSWGAVIAQNDPATKDVLTQDALDLPMLRLRMPDNGKGLLEWNGEGDTRTLRAKLYDSDVANKKWIPQGVNFTVGNDVYTASIDVTQIGDKQDVTYRVELPLGIDGTITSDKAAEILGLPAVLKTDSAGQLDVINTLMNSYDALEEVSKNKNALELVKAALGTGPDVLAVKTAITNVLNGCYNEDDELIVYALLKDCGGASANNAARLACYYQNYAVLKQQVKILADNMGAIADYQELNNLMIDAGYGEYYDEINNVKETFEVVETIVNNKPVNDHVLTDNLTALRALAEAVLSYEPASSGSVNIGASLTLDTVLSIATPGKTLVTVKVAVAGSAASGSSAQAIANKSATETDDNVRTRVNQLLTNQKGVALEQAGINGKTGFYDVDVTDEVASDQVYSAVESDAMSEVTVTFTYTPKTYKLTADSAEIASFSYTNPTVTLPVCTEVGCRYDYIIGGTAYAQGSAVTFSEADITRLFGSSTTCDITRTRVEILEERILNTIAAVNNKVTQESTLVTSKGALRLAMIPLKEDNGELSIVLRVSPESTMTLNDFMPVLETLAEELLGYDTVKLKDYAVVTKENGDKKIDLQALLDAVLSSGTSLEQVKSGITPDDTIVENTGLSYEDVIYAGAQVQVDKRDGDDDPTPVHQISLGGRLKINELEKLGAVMMQMPMTFDGKETQLYVTIEDFNQNPGTLKDVYKAIDQVDDYIGVDLNDKKINITLTDAYSDKAYQAMMLVALLTGESDIRNIGNKEDSAWNLSGTAKKIYNEVIYPLAQDGGLSLTTIQNTLLKFGVDADLTGGMYETVFNLVKNAIKNIPSDGMVWSGTPTSLSASGTVDGLVDKFKTLNTATGTEGTQTNALIDMLGNLLAGDSVNAKVDVKLDITPDYKYKAVSLSTDGVKFYDTGTVNFTGNTAMVILLNNVDSLTVTGSDVIVNLNGKTVGTLSCTDNLVVDSAQGDDEVGTVNHVTGGILTAGHYPNGIGNGTLKSGYALDPSNKVVNEYYTVEKTANGFDVKLIADANGLRAADADSAKAMAVDLATDIVLNYFTAQSLKVNGEEIYAFDVDDLSTFFANGELNVTDEKGNELLDKIRYDNIADLINQIARAICNFGALAKNLENKTAILRYNIATESWFAEASRDAAGDYLKLGITGTDAHAINQTVRLLIDSKNPGDQQFAVNSLKRLAEVATWNVYPQINPETADVSINNKTFTVTGKAKGELTLDLSKTPDYALTIALAIANSTSDETLKNALIAGIEKYYATKSVKELKTAIDAVSIQDIVSAVKALPSGYTFAGIAESLNLDPAARAGFASADSDNMKSYRNELRLLAEAAKAANFAGGTKKLALMAVNGQYGVYRYSNVNDHRVTTKEVKDGWGAKIDATLDSAIITLKLFNNYHQVQLSSAGVPNTTTVSVTGGGRYSKDTQVTITAPEVTGYDFLGWYRGDNSQLSGEMTYTFPMPDTDVNYVATYREHYNPGGNDKSVTGVSLDKTGITLEVGGTQTLIATVTPDDAANKEVHWESSDPNVAYVDQTGKVTARKAGTATITVTTVDGGKTASCEVTVIAGAHPGDPGDDHGGNHGNTGGSGTLTITTDLKNITVVKVDGKVVDSKYYTIIDGNIILSAEFLRTLPDGKHMFTAENDTHISRITFTIRNGVVVRSAATGDAGILLYVGAAFSSACSAVFVMDKNRKKGKREE